MFFRTGQLAGARFAVTDRYDGASAAPYDSLNLGGHVGDPAETVEDNRRRVARAAGLDRDDLVLMDQVHGTTVAQVAADRRQPVGDADAMVTAGPGPALVVLVADCVPVLLAARRSDVIGVAHAGRLGMAAGVVPATVAAMAELGARPDRMVAYVGPAICGRCYEVPAALQDDVAAAEPAARSTTRAGTPGLDVRAGVVAQLGAAGVGSMQVESWCTAERPDLYSYRRDGVTGRFAGLLWRAGGDG